MKRSFKFAKLIRDQFPRILKSQGITLFELVLKQEEYIQRLKAKLIEESEEINQAQSKEELLEELADLQEVILALSSTVGLTMQEIEEKRLETRKIKGGFENKIFCDHVEMEENNPILSYYLNRPKKYPEIKEKQDCLFCQMASGKKEVTYFAQFLHCFIIKDQFPVSPGHLLIIPFQHTENWFTASDEVRSDMIEALNVAKKMLDKEYCPQGYNIGANCGEVAGQTVMHLHLHLIPRYQGDMENPRGGVRGVIPSKQKY